MKTAYVTLINIYPSATDVSTFQEEIYDIDEVEWKTSHVVITTHLGSTYAYRADRVYELYVEEERERSEKHIEQDEV